MGSLGGEGEIISPTVVAWDGFELLLVMLTERICVGRNARNERTCFIFPAETAASSSEAIGEETS